MCMRVALDRRECHPENSAGEATPTNKMTLPLPHPFLVGACVTARANNPELDCATDGSFEALQCQLATPGLFECQCVIPATGMGISGTAVTVGNILDAPDCDSRGE